MMNCSHRHNLINLVSLDYFQDIILPPRDERQESLSDESDDSSQRDIPYSQAEAAVPRRLSDDHTPPITRSQSGHMLCKMISEIAQSSTIDMHSVSRDPDGLCPSYYFEARA